MVGGNGLVSGVGNAPFMGLNNNPNIFHLMKSHVKGVINTVIPNPVITKHRYTEGLIQR